MRFTHYCVIGATILIAGVAVANRQSWLVPGQSAIPECAERGTTIPAGCTYTTPRSPFGPSSAPPPPVAKRDEGEKKIAVPADPQTNPSSAGETAAGFAYFPPGQLLEQDKGRGRAGDRKIYLPDIIYPIRLLSGPERSPPGHHAHMNSQIWGYGGGGWNNKGAAGGTECDPRNYNPMVQRDNYCEVRGWDMPMCPAGQGHQGQDIRPPACDDNKWEVVAVVDGVITQVTSNTTVRLKGGDGTEYYYLHMHPDSIKVEEGQNVKQGEVLGRVSNFMNGARDTTHHMHFQVKQSIKIGKSVQRVYVPPFASLIAAYRRSKGLDPGIDSDGNLIEDAAYEIGVVARAEKPKPAFTTWPVTNVSGIDGRPIAAVNLARAFRPTNDKAVLSYVATGLPDGLTLDPKTGVIVGNLAPGASRGGVSGVYTVAASATDQNGNTAAENFTIVVAKSAPIIVAATDSKTFREGQSVLIAAGSAFTDPSLYALTFSATGLPDGLMIDASTGRISGQAPAGSSSAKPNGVYAVAVTASDEQGGAATENFTITIEPPKPVEPVKPVALLPVIIAPVPSATIFAGQELSTIDLTQYFRAGGDGKAPLRYAASGLPPDLKIDGATGAISGVVALSAAAGGGSFPVTVTVSNAQGDSIKQSFVLTVRNQPPIVVTQTVNKSYAVGDRVLITAGSAFSEPATSVVTYAITGAPDGLAIDSKQGIISGVMPAGAVKDGKETVYTVAVVADDGQGGTASETFTITAKPAPPKPVPLPPVMVAPTGPTILVQAGDPFPTFTAGANFSPATATGGPLQFSADGLPKVLTINASTGIIVGTLSDDAATAVAGGTYVVKVTATDQSNGLSSTGTFSIQVQPKSISKVDPAKPDPTKGGTPPVTQPQDPAKPPAAGRTWWGWANETASSWWNWAFNKKK